MLGTILAMEVPTDKGRYRRKCVQSKVRLKRGELEFSMSGTIACYGGAHIKFFRCGLYQQVNLAKETITGRSSKQRNVCYNFLTELLVTGTIKVKDWQFLHTTGNG